MHGSIIRKTLLGLVFLLQATFSIAQVDVIPFCGTDEQIESKKKSRENLSIDYTNKYNNLNTWIPYMDPAFPLKNPPITTVEITFHIFLDQNGGNSKYTNDLVGRQNITDVFNHLNNIFAGATGPSDPPPGLVGLPNNDTRIRFSLGPNNERIYFYNDNALNQSYAMPGQANSLFETYIQTNYPSRGTKLNIYFTAGRFRGGVSNNRVLMTNIGSGYSSAPTVTFSPTGPIGTATINGSGQVTGITVSNPSALSATYTHSVTISGGGGTGATAIVFNPIYVTNPGSGYTSTPTVTFSGGDWGPGGANGQYMHQASATAIVSGGQLIGLNVTNGGSYNGTLPPTVTITGGGGTGAAVTIKAISGGAGGVAVMPNNNLNQTINSVMPMAHEMTVWITGFTVAHELGHLLGLWHTANTDAICNCTNPDFLSDIFGTTACVNGNNTKCPHTSTFQDPWTDSYNPPLTNNVMGGSIDQHYLSPMQVGIMHRALALLSPRKYVLKETYTSTPLTLTTSETWDFNLKLYRDVVIDNNSTLTITNTTFELPYNAVIRVKNGSTLRIEGTVNNYNNNNIIIEAGGLLKVTSNGIINMKAGSIITINTGGYLCIDNSSSLVFNDPSAKLIIDGKTYYGLTLGAATASAMSYASTPIPTGTNFYTSVTTSGSTSMSVGSTLVKAKTYIELTPNTHLTTVSGSYLLGLIQTDDYISNCPPGFIIANPGEEETKEPQNNSNKQTSNSSKVMPNPSNGHFHLDLSAITTSAKVNVTVKNSMSETVYSNEFPTKTIQPLNLRGLPNGIYFVLVSGDNYNETHRIIIEK